MKKVYFKKTNTGAALRIFGLRIQFFGGDRSTLAARVRVTIGNKVFHLF